MRPILRGCRPSRTHVAALALAAVVFGCTGADDPVEPGTDDEGTSATDTAPVDEDDGDDEAPDDGDGAVFEAGRLELEGWTQDHPSGVSMTLTAIEVDDDGHLYLDVDVANERGGSGYLEWTCCRTFVEDDQGARYPLVPPEDDRRVQVDDGRRLTGTLAFEGPLDADAQRVTLAVNARQDEIVEAGTEDPVDSVAPAFAFRDIPLPGIGLDEEAVRDVDGDLADMDFVDAGVSAQPLPGAQVTVERVGSDGRRVMVEVTVENDSERPLRLIAVSPRLEVEGARFSFTRIEDATDEERTLEVPPGGEASAVLTFVGTVPSDAEELTLVFNPHRGDGGTDVLSAEVVVEGLPVPTGAPTGD